MHKLKQFWQSLENNEKLKNFLEKIIKGYFILFGAFFAYMIIGSVILIYMWGESEKKQIKECVVLGIDYEECRDLYNW